jgi:hypothetical protein
MCSWCSLERACGTKEDEKLKLFTSWLGEISELIFSTFFGGLKNGLHKFLNITKLRLTLGACKWKYFEAFSLFEGLNNL